MNKLNILSLVVLLSAAVMADQRTELIDLLKAKSFVYNPNEARVSYTYKGKEYKVDPETGVYFFETAPGERKEVDIDWEGDRGTIREGRKILHRLNGRTMTKADSIGFNSLALYQRLLGIWTSKSKNPECYIALAIARYPDLTEDEVLSKLLALEREDNPRPLFFKSDEEYQEFKDDVKNIFADFKDPQSYIALIGSSTTFFSVNPTKGDSLALFVPAPQCVENAKDPDLSDLIKTIDTPGSDKSDLDINVLMPWLSELCEKASEDSRKMGNDGTRRVYIENKLDKCFMASSDPKVQALAQGGVQEDKWPLKGKAFEDFLEKWTPRLDDREINWSVRILPNQQKEPSKVPDAPADFEVDKTYERFLIPVN